MQKVEAKPKSRDKFFILILGMFLAWSGLPVLMHAVYISLIALAFWVGFCLSHGALPSNWGVVLAILASVGAFFCGVGLGTSE